MSKRLTLFDSIKGIAIIAIFMIHMGNWIPILDVNSIRMRIINQGYLGVELTYMVNAYFFTKYYMNRVKTGEIGTFQFVMKMLVRLAPVYFIAMIAYAVSTYAATGTLPATPMNIAANFLFLNVLNPYWFNSFFGGSGYIAVLVLLWYIFSLYLKKINTLNESIIGAVLMCVIAYTLFMIAMYIVRVNAFSDAGIINNWLSYIERGICSFSMGTVLYFADESGIFDGTSRFCKYLIPIIGGVYIVTSVIYSNSVNGFVFILISFFIILVNLKDAVPIVDNAVFAGIGKYSMEIFVSHILLCYILLWNQKLLTVGGEAYAIITILTIMLSLALKHFIQIPWNKLVNKWFDTSNRQKQIGEDK